MEKLLIQYKQILSDYISNRNEQDLYIGQNYIRQLIQKNVAPEDVINIHRKAVEEIYDQLPNSLTHAYDFLIEVMVQFGLKFREHQSLLIQQEELRIEMDIATKIQNILLKTTIPKLEQLDIGMISKPIRKMNGDYVYFLYDERKLFKCCSYRCSWKRSSCSIMYVNGEKWFRNIEIMQITILLMF